MLFGNSRGTRGVLYVVVNTVRAINGYSHAQLLQAFASCTMLRSHKDRSYLGVEQSSWQHLISSCWRSLASPWLG